MPRTYHPYFSIPPLLLLLPFLLLGGCHSSQSSDQSTAAAVDTVRFAQQVKAEYAEGFNISYHDNYKLLEILHPFQDRVDTLRYSLVPRELASKIDIEGSREIPIPVRSLVATSTTHVGLTEMLDANEVISGMSGAEYVYNENIRKLVRQDSIVSFNQGELNKEKVIAMNPDLLMVSGGQSGQFENFRVLRDSGINLMVNSEWLETTPLGKAEWVKVMAALLNKEALANRRFDEVARKYNSLKASVDTVDTKPLVINNLPYKGVWFVSGGESFTARFLKDAGADYPWYESGETGGLRKDLEVVYEVGLEAEIWINPGAAETKEDILAKDARFRDFRSFQTGQIYNNNRRVHPSGGNDFWESGVVHPEIVLADLIKIFHPQIVPDHELYYYQRIE